ncbi:hypothetical protein SAMN04489765_3127 [Tsukamurella pulmonis]|uniref:Uncharacterized protein n=2 Tax=Tsukamurella pulmonis TaxID=47312 RepID=A0A1H1G6U7_9ACTN|nr:hypothetical protein [Tsukamurella pulmonis]SDR08546.1 hypothetical protein SAMN04489765_3127 [Tsukamurella pulmonis]
MRQVLAAAQARNNAAASYVNDPMLSEAGNRQARARLAEQAKAAFDLTMDEVLESASRKVTTEVFTKALEHRPPFNRNDPAAAIITAQAWQFNVLPRLERGEQLVDVLKAADTDAVLGAERFAPAYLSGPRGSGLNAIFYDATDDVARAVTGRFIGLADSPEAAAAIEEAEHFHDDFDALLRTVQLVRRGDTASAIEAATLVGSTIAEAAPDARPEGDDAAGAGGASESVGESSA